MVWCFLESIGKAVRDGVENYRLSFEKGRVLVGKGVLTGSFWPTQRQAAELHATTPALLPRVYYMPDFYKSLQTDQLHGRGLRDAWIAASHARAGLQQRAAATWQWAAEQRHLSMPHMCRRAVQGQNLLALVFQALFVC